MERPAQVIERLRLERGLSQAQASALGGLARATWSTVESGLTANPHPDTRLRIARALGVTPSSIWLLRPPPLHLEDVEDPRWDSAVRAMARRLDLDGSMEERRRFADRLVAVLDIVDRGSEDSEEADGRWEEFWQIASSLLFDPATTPIAIIDGRIVEREPDRFIDATRGPAITARRRSGGGVHEQS